MGKLADFIPSVDNVVADPLKWSNPWALPVNQAQYGTDQKKQDKVTKLQKSAYDASHPDPSTPSRSQTNLAARRAAANRRASGGLVSSVLSDTETLG